MRSDHLAKHTKTHDNKAKKLIAKKDKHAKVQSTPTAIVKQEKIDDELDIKPQMLTDIDQNHGSGIWETPRLNCSLPKVPLHNIKPSIEDYYQSYHHYQPSYMFHQNPSSRLYPAAAAVDKSYIYSADNRNGMFSASSAAVGANSISQSSGTHDIQNGYFHRPGHNYSTMSHGESIHAAAAAAAAADQNYLLNINTSNVMININSQTTNMTHNNNYQSQHN